LVPFALIVALAVIWTGLWFYAVSAAEGALAGWRAREAKAGRVFECGRERVSGFPFRFEFLCADPTLELRGSTPALALKAKDLIVAAQIYQPTLLIGEFSAPLTLAQQGQPPAYEANWRLAQSSLRGTPRAPERLSLVFDDPVVEQLLPDKLRKTVFHAKRVELHGRIAEGSVTDSPVIEAVVRATAATAPADVHPLMAVPLDADLAATLRGLANFAPKPWPARFRELQARGGRIEITKARVQQGETIAVGTGSLKLTERGNLDGQIELTVVGIEQFLKSLDIERLVSQGRVSASIDRLDRLLPGLGKIARKNATPGILAGLGLFGKQTTLEDKPAVAVPLRLADGLAMLGPIPLGRLPPLF
jgi:hypothetical protein